MKLDKLLLEYVGKEGFKADRKGVAITAWFPLEQIAESVASLLDEEGEIEKGAVKKVLKVLRENPKILNSWGQYMFAHLDEATASADFNDAMIDADEMVAERVRKHL